MDSVLNQMDAKAEVRVYLGVDGDIDADLQEAIEYYSPRIYKLVKSNRNIGLASILNLMIKSLKGETYIARMDSDDISLPSRLSKQVLLLRERSEVDVCGCAIIEYDERTESMLLRQYPKTESIVSALSKGTPIAHPTAMFRGDFFRRFGTYKEDTRASEDIELWMRAVYLGAKLENIDEPLLIFRKSSEFAARRSIKKAVSEFWIYVDGIVRLHGTSYKLVYPLFRLGFRLLPRTLINFIYGMGLLRNGKTNRVKYSDYEKYLGN